MCVSCVHKQGMCVCDVGGRCSGCVCGMWHMCNQPLLARALTYPRSFLLEKENENLLSLFPDRGDFSNFCSSSIFSRESGLLF